MFSPEQYRALHEGAGLLDRTERGQLLFTGADRLAFLQGLLSNDVLALQPGSGCYASLLTAQGRMIADMRVVELGDSTIIELAARQAAALRDRFDQSIFSEDAQVEDVTIARAEVGIYGPLAADVVGAALLPDAAAGDLAAPRDACRSMPISALDTFAGTVVAVRSDEVGVTGFDLLVDKSQVGAIVDRLRAAGAVDVGSDTAETTRIEAGRPKFGVDMDEETIPLEAGIEHRAISLTKGCYVGQEIIIRVLHRGQGRVARRLVGVALDGPGVVPVKGDMLRVGDRQVGVVTSATHSPALGGRLAMAYVHRDFAEPGTAVVVASDGTPQPAVVTRLPIGGTGQPPDGRNAALASEASPSARGA